MPDITMCPGEYCHIKYKCYRFTAKPKEHNQSWALFKPNADGTCDHFKPNRNQPEQSKVD